MTNEWPHYCSLLITVSDSAGSGIYLDIHTQGPLQYNNYKEIVLIDLQYSLMMSQAVCSLLEYSLAILQFII